MNRFERRVASPRVINIEDLRRMPRKRLPRVVYEFLDGAAKDAGGPLPLRYPVNSLLPGTIYTPFVEGFLRRHYADNIEAATDNLRKRQVSKTFGTPEDVAYAALYLASDEANYVFGSGLVIDGGLLAGKIFD
jgi:Enoyl-(Acyl carrier protein) reductase